LISRQIPRFSPKFDSYLSKMRYKLLIEAELSPKAYTTNIYHFCPKSNIATKCT
jgi:hypothetical protein